MTVEKNFLFLPALFFCFFLFACQSENQPPKEIPASVDEIIDADIAFSEMCKEKGLRNSFIDFMDNEGILLRPDHLPVKGADAIEFLSQVNDDSYKLSWVPEGAQISKGGDMGFTYGIFKLAGTDTVFNGTYVNVWKKQADGKWKFMLNSASQGIGETE
ncbi:MAG: DUF4440 domain-containing protein, partial [Ginsengibacter sp.]